jgi:hypothetical protein
MSKPRISDSVKDCIDLMRTFEKKSLALEEKIQKIEDTKRSLESRIAGKSLDISLLRKHLYLQSAKRFFSAERVLAMLGGRWPKDKSGFCWETVEHFKLVGKRLVPYAGDEILPGPDIIIKCSIE